MEKTPQSKRIIRMQHTTHKVGLKQSAVFDLVARGLFPKPFSIVPGGRAKGWLEEDIDQWILQRKAATDREAV
jgi:prophage regulatory protein